MSVAPPSAATAPWDEGLLDVGDGHRVRYEQWGRRDGIPVVSLHGGPGSGSSPRHREFFDAARYRIVLFDQRGCGGSTPRGRLEANTTAHLVTDLERLRAHLDIDGWLVFGGSWGACLALAYAASHPGACRGLVLRASFLAERAELRWFFRGARLLLPDAWTDFAAPAPAARRGDLLAWYADTLRGADTEASRDALRRWMRWEAALAAPAAPVPPSSPLEPAEAARLLDKYRVQSHYLRHDCFLGPGQALPRALQCARRLRGLPVALLHGRIDLVCRPDNAWRLHRALPGSRLRFVDGAGHDPFAPSMLSAIVELTDHFARHGGFDGWGEAYG